MKNGGQAPSKCHRHVVLFKNRANYGVYRKTTWKSVVMNFSGGSGCVYGWLLALPHLNELDKHYLSVPTTGDMYLLLAHSFKSQCVQTDY